VYNYDGYHDGIAAAASEQYPDLIHLGTYSDNTMHSALADSHDDDTFYTHSRAPIGNMEIAVFVCVFLALLSCVCIVVGCGIGFIVGFVAPYLQRLGFGVGYKHRGEQSSEERLSEDV